MDGSGSDRVGPFVVVDMSNLTLDRPVVPRTSSVRHAPALPAIGSYVDTDGVRRAPRRTGSYAGTTTAVGSWTGQRPSVVGSYVRTER
jgi:hypothetical protein